MKKMKSWNTLLFCVVILHTCLVNGQICPLQGLKADCYYRLAVIHMSNIRVYINKCDSPVSVTISIDEMNSDHSWTTKVDTNVDRKEVPGYSSKVFIVTRQSYAESGKYRLDIDFIIEGHPKVDFMDEEVKLVTDDCTQLSKPAIIAIGVLVPVCVIVFVAIVIIIILLRRKQRRATSNSLVLNGERQGETDPPVVNTSEQTDCNGDCVQGEQLPSSRDSVVCFTDVVNNDIQNHNAVVV